MFNSSHGRLQLCGTLRSLSAFLGFVVSDLGSAPRASVISCPPPEAASPALHHANTASLPSSLQLLHCTEHEMDTEGTALGKYNSPL